MTNRLGEIVFSNAVLCEDVRREIGNKATLVGVFSENIMISEMPGQLTVAFYFEVKSETGEDRLIYLRLSGPGDGSAVLKALCNFPGPGRVAAANTPQITIPVTEPGILRIDVSVDEKDWLNLISKEVSLGDPSVFQQPSGQSPRAAPVS